MRQITRLARLMPKRVHIDTLLISRKKQGRFERESQEQNPRSTTGGCQTPKREAQRGAGDKNGARIIGSNDGSDDGTDGAAPTVEEIRVALLRKSTNGKSPQ